MAHPHGGRLRTEQGARGGNRAAPSGDPVTGNFPADPPGETRDAVRRRLWNTVDVRGVRDG